MNFVAQQIAAYFGSSKDEPLMHYGMPRRSGRYPWGSGDDPYQRTRDFLGRVEQLKKAGWKETPENIKAEFGLSTTQYRTQKTIAQNERDLLEIATIKSLREDGLTTTEIGKKLGINESSVRSKLKSTHVDKLEEAKKTAAFIKEQVDKNGNADVGANVELELNISKEKLNQAVSILQMEGYELRGGRVDQVNNPGQKTTLKVLYPPGAAKNALYESLKTGDIHSLNDYVSHDGGETFDKFVYPKSLDSSRLKINYKEDGGIDKDGIIELRRGVSDISLGNDRYAQVRILVDGNKYLKGMAVYSDNMPDGVDVVFNTNNSKSTPKMDVLKSIKEDPDNPFGSLIKAGGQSYYDDENGNKQLSVINKARSEGDWSDWKDALPAQFLAKQSKALADRQLGLAIADKVSEYEKINSLENPTVKKYFLNKFAEECDSAAVHLQAAALPGQQYHVIIPITSMKDTEVYAPNYANGTKLALVRYPHAGTFEIPILTVNNKQSEAVSAFGKDIGDGICINSKVAERLSGADFDGDTVMCIPTGGKTGINIASRNPLQGLEGFDPKTVYGYDSVSTDSSGAKHYYRNGKEFQVMANKGTQMGSISNLITDMTLLGADDEELAAAVRHSMVVIDAEKHHLDYKQSEIDNNISALHKAYQGKSTGGAATLISRSKGQYSVTKRQGTPIINLKANEGKVDKNGNALYDSSKPEGALLYKTADDAYYETTKINKRTGEISVVTKERTQRSTKMGETDDARTLISAANTQMEQAYADYANKMKALANDARKELMVTGNLKYDPTANKTYKEEVASLNSKLNTALLNSPKERIAQTKAQAVVIAKTKAYEESKGEQMSTSDKKKIGQQALTKARQEVGSVARKSRSIEITDKEWEAIQAGAVTENTLQRILNNSDADSLRQRATPRTNSGQLTASQISRIKAYAASGRSLNQIAEALGVSTSTVTKYLKGVN